MVNMNTAHPGGGDNAYFRNYYIYNAIKSSQVTNYISFRDYDKDNNGNIDIHEMQIIFIVAGGESAYAGSDIATSIWSSAWSFSSNTAPIIDGIKVMSDPVGSYSQFGANHGNHKAAIGIIVHELGHAMLSLRDFYDDGGGSGLGWYDVMSSGSWGKQVGDQYPGDTPTQFSTYNKTLAGLDMNRTVVNSSTTLTIKCSTNDDIKLTTTNSNEYFLIECRDTQKPNSDISMNNATVKWHALSNASFYNRLFTLIYHVDDLKTNNHEDGIQTNSHHYNISILEKDSSTNVMTTQTGIYADYNDVYIQGDVIESSKTHLYDGTATGYRIEVTNEDYTNRTMTIKISK
jgi:M6 family metalloprotease-like protein